jgi:hypothetical protein
MGFVTKWEDLHSGIPEDRGIGYLTHYDYFDIEEQ